MNGQSVELLKKRCEEWLIKCIICHCCGNLPKSLWKCGCDHLFCGTCKQSLKKCDLCSLPFTRRSKKNKGPIQEHVYDNLIEPARELIACLNIDVSSLVRSTKGVSEQNEIESESKPGRKRKGAVSPKKEQKLEKRKRVLQKDSKVSVTVVDSNDLDGGSGNKDLMDDSEDDKIETKNEEKAVNKFGNRKYVRKKLITEVPKGRKSKSEDLFDKVVDSESSERNHQRKETSNRSTKVELASTDDDSSDDEVLELPQVNRRKRPVAQKITSKKEEFLKPVSPVRRTQRTTAKTDTTANRSRKPTRKSASLSPKKKEFNASNEKSNKVGEKVYDFKQEEEEEEDDNVEDEEEEEEEKPVKKVTRKRSKLDSSKEEGKDRKESLKREHGRLRARSTSTVKSESIKSRNSSPKNSIVLLATSLTQDEMSQLYKFRQKFHCKMKAKYENDVTHVICKTVEHNYTSRTIKYLHGLVGNKWLLSNDWIEDSLREGEILLEDPYEVRGTCKDKVASNGAPKKSRTTQMKLFKECVAYFEGNFIPQNIPPKYELIKLFKCAGGNVVDTTHKLSAVIKKKQKLIIVREDNQEASAATKSLKSVNVADLLSMVTEFSVNNTFVNFA